MSYRPLGFMDVVPDLEIRLKQGGLGRLGEVMRPNQREFLGRVKRYREEQRPICWVELKARQWVSMSTITGGVVTGDTVANAGWNSIVTAQDADSLNEISQIYRHFFGRTKVEGKKQGRVERLADTQFVASNGSRIKLQVADEDLGRSGSIQDLHISEAGYIRDWQESWRSIQPAVSWGSWWLFIVMETTLRRGQSGSFRDFIEELADAEEAGKPSPYPPWEVHFTGWHANPSLRVPMSGAELEEFMRVCPPYEAELVMKHGLTWEQARWYFDTRLGGMLGSYEGMHEAYPTTLREALAGSRGAAFFYGEAIKFYNESVRDPIQRLKVKNGALVPFEEGDSPLDPHVEVWEPAEFGAEYIIGADCADAEERQRVEGSENAAVCVNKRTGDMAAVYHGFSNSHEFALVLVLMAKRYNNAELNPEVNNAGRAVMDHCRTTLHYSRFSPRERFAYGQSAGIVEGMFGFETRANTRQLLIDRLQMGVNKRLWSIPSRYVLDCLKSMARNNGIKVKAQQKNASPDDGAIGLGLTGFGHNNLVEGVWKPKQAWVPPLVEDVAPARSSAYRIERPDRDRLRWDPVRNCFR